MRKFLIGLAALTAVMTGLVFAADVGPKADVAALRAAKHQIDPQSFTSAVHVAGNYALLNWYYIGAGSGSYAFKRSSGERWNVVAGAAGSLFSITLLVQHGVPASVARQLCSGWPKGSSACSGF